jgi:hypothetical protein
MENSKGPAFEFYKVPDVQTPYNGAVPGFLTEGTKVFARVKVNPDPKQFVVNLKCDNGIAMHFNPRFDQAVTVCNSFDGNSNQWGYEVRANSVPFEAGSSYGIEMNVHADKFEVIVEGEHLIDLPHAMPFQLVRSLSIKGDIEVQMVIYHG